MIANLKIENEFKFEKFRRSLANKTMEIKK